MGSLAISAHLACGLLKGHRCKASSSANVRRRSGGETKVSGGVEGNRVIINADFSAKKTAQRAKDSKKSRRDKRKMLGEGPMSGNHNSKTSKRLWYILLILPFVALLYPPFYAQMEPRLFGFPYFYWYQLAWVPISSLLTGIVYLRSR